MRKNFILVFLLTILLASGGLSFAGNSSDTGYSFYFTADRTIISTEKRAKQDKTSSYVKVNSGKNLSNGINMTMVGGNYQDVGSSVKTFYAPGSAKIPQYTKEWNINDTRLQGRRIINTYMTVFGLWSPDSI